MAVNLSSRHPFSCAVAASELASVSPLFCVGTPAAGERNSATTAFLLW